MIKRERCIGCPPQAGIKVKVVRDMKRRNDMNDEYANKRRRMDSFHYTMKRVVTLLFISIIFCIQLDATSRSLQQKRLHKQQKLTALDKKEYAARNSGKAYYESLVERASKRRWAVQTSFNYATQDGAFNCDGCHVPLDGLIFGTDTLTIKDVYLFSKLSDDNKVRINNCNALVPDRGGVPIGGVGVPFGGFSDDLYTTLLAPVELDFGAGQKEYSAIISVLRRFDIGSSDRFAIACGMSIPLVHKQHTMDLNFQGGELFRPGYIPDTTQRENSLQQFYRDYSSLTDFINRAVLGANGIEFLADQSKTGIGDISLFGSIEYHGRHTLQAGLAVVFPTAGKRSGCTLWEPILGNGGAYECNPFVQGLCFTAVPYLNPFARIALGISAGYTTDTSRIPTLVTNPKRQMVHKVEGLSAPDSFQNFYVDPFSEYDTSVPLFAAKTPCVSKKTGTKLLFGIGNYAYQLFHVNLRWGLLYDFYYKSTDSFTVNNSASCQCNPETIDCAAVECCSDENSHSLSTNLIYTFNNLFELGVGGSFTVLGKNVPRTRSCFFTFVAVF
jgi:hypothetical protein